MISTAFAPGKLIISGEHSVVYGHRAIAAAVNLGTTVQLTSRPGPTRIDVSDFVDDRLMAAIHTILPRNGVGVKLTSTLPIGRGMGSSGSLSVALIRANALLEGRSASFEECHEKGFLIEKIFHGDPSGLDHTISSLGGVVVYQPGTPVKPLALSPLRLVVMDSRQKGDTLQMVEQVKAKAHLRPIIDNISSLTEQMISGLSSGIGQADLGILITKNHQLLARLGVSTPLLDKLVDTSINAGAFGAKLSGAGGGGVAFALVDDPNPIVSAVNNLCDPFVVNIPTTVD